MTTWDVVRGELWASAHFLSPKTWSSFTIQTGFALIVGGLVQAVLGAADRALPWLFLGPWLVFITAGPALGTAREVRRHRAVWPVSAGR